MRSNLAVGLPIELAIPPRDASQVELSYRIEPGDEYFSNLHLRWSEALRATYQAIPRPTYAAGPGR